MSWTRRPVGPRSGAADASEGGLYASSDPAGAAPSEEGGRAAALSSRTAAIAERIERLREAARSEDDREFLVRLGEQLERARPMLPPLPLGGLWAPESLAAPTPCSALDAALRRRLIDIASQPPFADLEAVRSAAEAADRIGPTETRNVVLTQTLRTRAFQVAGREREVACLWGHSVAVAVAAEVLAAAVGLDPAAAFVVGLLHDAGRLVVWSWTREVERASRGTLRPAVLLAREIDAALHAPLGALVTAASALDPELVSAIEQHHDAPSGPPGCTWSDLLRCADLTAHRGGAPAGLRSISDAEWQAAVSALGLESGGADLEEDARRELKLRESRF